MNYIEIARNLYLEAAKILLAQNANPPSDPQADSPNIIFPQEKPIQMAVDLIRKKDSSYFARKGPNKPGVKDIIVKSLPAGTYGRVSSEAPNTIEIDYRQIKDKVTNDLKSKNPSITEDALNESLARSIGNVIMHERGHVGSFSLEKHEFVGGESVAEQEEKVFNL